MCAGHLVVPTPLFREILCPSCLLSIGHSGHTTIQAFLPLVYLCFLFPVSPFFFFFSFFGPILDDRLKEKILKPWKGVHSFLFFEIFIFTLFIGIFQFFPYITLVNLCFQATGHSFSCRNMIFGLREPCTIRNWRLLTFFENSIFLRLYGPFFRFVGNFSI